MYCPNCGNKVIEGAKFCGMCGAKLQNVTAPNSVPYVGTSSGRIVCPVCGKEQRADRKRCFDCGLWFGENAGMNTQPSPAARQGNAESGDTYPQADNTYQASGRIDAGRPSMPRQNASPYTEPQKNQQNYSMGWYKFLIYFVCPATAVVAGIYAIVLFTGAQYAGYSSFVYGFFPGLRVADVLLGLVSLIEIPLAIYTRQALAGFREVGPKLVVFLYVFNGIADVIYVIIYAATLTSAVGYGIGASTGSVVGILVFSFGCAVANHIYFNNRKSLFVNL